MLWWRTLHLSLRKASMVAVEWWVLKRKEERGWWWWRSLERDDDGGIGCDGGAGGV